MSRPNPTEHQEGNADGRHAVVLKAGAATNQLFMFPGAGCDWREVAPLASLVGAPWAVVGIEAWRASLPSGEPPHTVEQMAQVAFAAIKALQPQGPYHLSGYSFGGLVAFEAAAALTARGDEVRFLALIDCRYHHRFWSVGERLRHRLSRVARIAQMPPKVRFARARRSARRIVRRLAVRLRGQTTAPLSQLARCETAHAMYRPGAYDGRVIVLGPDGSQAFGVDPAKLWGRYARAVEVTRVAGRHHELVRSIVRVKTLANALNELLRPLAAAQHRD